MERHGRRRFCSRNCAQQSQRRPLGERFWEKVEKKDTGCWEWNASTANGGYGEIALGEGKKKIRATHVSWLIHSGNPVPEGLIVCHKCDNPPCVNPDHLFLGTYKDNFRDMLSKGRHYGGEKHRHALSRDRVAEIEGALDADESDGVNESWDDSIASIGSSYAFESAREHGCVVVLPDDDQLFIDLDGKDCLALYERRVKKFKQHVLDVKEESIRASRSDGCYHVTLRLERAVSKEERILFQALLGSDGTRELLSYVRLINDDEHPTLFFEKATP